MSAPIAVTLVRPLSVSGGAAPIAVTQVTPGHNTPGASAQISADPGNTLTQGTDAKLYVSAPPIPAPTTYLHTQPVPATSWTINHNLGHHPAVSALSVGGVVMLANVIHTSLNQAVIEFDQPTAGQAVCS